MSGAREFTHLGRAKVAVGDRGDHLAVGGLYPRSVEIGEFEIFMGNVLRMIPSGPVCRENRRLAISQSDRFFP